jgi:hypothetical protein
MVLARLDKTGSSVLCGAKGGHCPFEIGRAVERVYHGDYPGLRAFWFQPGWMQGPNGIWPPSSYNEERIDDLNAGWYRGSGGTKVPIGRRKLQAAARDDGERVA